MLSSEEARRASGVAWTILRPCAFMSKALRWIPQLRAGEVIGVPFGDVAAAAIDPYDIARVAAVALTSDGRDGQAYRLCGAESLLPAAQVRVLGGNLRLRPQPDEQARAEMSASMPAEYVDAFFRFNRDGVLDESQELPTVLEITGERRRCFEQWAELHADPFR